MPHRAKCPFFHMRLSSLRVFSVSFYLTRRLTCLASSATSLFSVLRIICSQETMRNLAIKKNRHLKNYRVSSCPAKGRICRSGNSFFYAQHFAKVERILGALCVNCIHH